MRRECPICGAHLTRHGVGSTKFEGSTEILRCQGCDYETPGTYELEGSAHVAAARLRALAVPTRLECPYCTGGVSYIVREETIVCGDCRYQEYWPKDRALGLLPR